MMQGGTARSRETRDPTRESTQAKLLHSRVVLTGSA